MPLVDHNPMRYSGGLLGGSWLTAMTADLGHGKIDGTGLIPNFAVLNSTYWLWGIRQRRVGLGHSDKRRTDDRAPYLASNQGR
jgi:hypothetical protein